MLRSVQINFLIENIITYPIAFQTFHLKACPKSGNLSLGFHCTLHVIDTADKYEYLFQHSAGSSSQLPVTG